MSTHQKDFQKWHKIKEGLDSDAARIFFHEREVWWCSIGINVGFEQDGRGERFARPILVFKKFNNEVFWAIPLSTKIKKVNSIRRLSWKTVFCEWLLFRS